MLRISCCVIIMILCISFCGCSKLDMSNFSIPNPFASTPADVNDVYYGNFPDISIPRDMTIDHARTLVSVGPAGEKIGLLTFEGRVDRVSLCSAMIHNMCRQGWTLRGVTDGKRTVQLYEKKGRYSILYIYGQKVSTAIEVWVLSRLDDGIYQSGSMMERNEEVYPFYSPTDSKDNDGVEVIHRGLTE